LDTVLALCPFHRHRDGSREKCASMVVHLGSERYFCFACEAEGSLAELLGGPENQNPPGVPKGWGLDEGGVGSNDRSV